MKFWKRFLLLVLILLLGGCSLFDKDESSAVESDPAEISQLEDEGDGEYPVRAGGAEVLARPGRVVSLAPALTEKLYDLGMVDRLAGRSEFCDYPASVENLPMCGTAQMPDVEAILALKPHLVLAEAALPEETLEQLEAEGIPVAVLPHANSLTELLDNYTALACLLEGSSSGQLIGDSIAADYRDYLAYLTDELEFYTQERVSVLYLRLLDFTVATGDSFENDLLRAICVDNIAAQYSGWEYPADDASEAAGLEAFRSIDLIYMDESAVTITDLEKSAFYKGLPATLYDRYFYIDCLLIERQSLRTLDMLAEMARAAYPQAALENFGLWSGQEDSADSGRDEEEYEGEDMLSALENMP